MFENVCIIITNELVYRYMAAIILD